MFRSSFITSCFLVGFVSLSVLPNASARVRLLIPESLQRVPVDTRSQTGRVPFDELQKKFDSARGLSIRDIKGWYSGRCFYSDSPTQPVPSLLVVEGDANSSANGPAFQGADYRRIIPLIKTDAKPDYFDSLSDAIQKQVRSAVSGYKNANSYPSNSNDTLVVDGLRTADLEARQYLVRKLGNYIYLRLTCNESSYCMNYRNEIPTNRVLVYEGQSPVACYYFKRVKN